MNKIKEENYMIISVNAKNTLDKMQHPLPTQRLGIQISQSDKEHLQKYLHLTSYLMMKYKSKNALIISVQIVL